MLLSMKYSFLSTVKEFDSIFWSGVFPLILATLFSLSFGSYVNEIEYNPVQTGIVIEDDESEFLTIVSELEGEYLETQEYSLSEAKAALANGEISGYYLIFDDISLKVSGEGLNSSILSGILSEYDKNILLIENVLNDHPENIGKVIESMSLSETKINDVGLTGKVINVNNQFFYALIAMACLYGNFIGVKAMINIQANLSTLGMRRSITPTHKMKVIMSEFTVNVLLHFVNVLVLLIYLKILGVKLDGSILMILPVCLLGALCGVALGMLIGSISGRSENFKTGICLGISMTASFLAGLMYAGMKGVVEVNAPIINMINPAALISDAFYSMTVYESIDRYQTDLLILAAETAVMLVISFMILRRERYDSV